MHEFLGELTRKEVTGMRDQVPEIFSDSDHNVLSVVIIIIEQKSEHMPIEKVLRSKIDLLLAATGSSYVVSFRREYPSEIQQSAILP